MTSRSENIPYPSHRPLQGRAKRKGVSSSDLLGLSRQAYYRSIRYIRRSPGHLTKGDCSCETNIGLNALMGKKKWTTFCNYRITPLALKAKKQYKNEGNISLSHLHNQKVRKIY